MKICIPVLEQNGFRSKMSPHFGRAGLFAILDNETQELTFVQNNGQHHGGTLTPPEIIGRQGADVLLCGGLGVKAVHLFEQQGIQVYCDASGTIKDALEAYNNGQLSKATETTACQHHDH